MTATQHATRVKSFSAAGDRSHVAFCENCQRNVGNPTTDRERATTDALQHAANPSRAGARL